MRLLEPGFTPASRCRARRGPHPDDRPPRNRGRRRRRPTAAEFEVVTLDRDILDAGAQAFAAIYFAEMWDIDHGLVEANRDDVGADIAAAVATADVFRPGVDATRLALAEWKDQFFELFGRVELLALPTLPIFPPRLDEITPESLLPLVIEITEHVAVFNVAGTPCTAQPVPTPGQRVPASLQLVGPLRGEELLVTTAQHVEDSVRL